MLHDALDGAPFPRRITPFEQNDDSLPGLLDPALHLQKLDLQLLFLFFILLAPHHPLVGVITILEDILFAEHTDIVTLSLRR